MGSMGVGAWIYFRLGNRVKFMGYPLSFPVCIHVQNTLWNKDIRLFSGHCQEQGQNQSTRIKNKNRKRLAL
jgi:hypothetical protein